MIRFQVAVVASVVALCALPLLASAGGIPDPHVIITDPPGSCTSITGLQFDFQADMSGGGNLCFTNNSGIAWFDLEFTILNPFASNQLTCGGNIFLSCDFEVENGFVVVDFFNGSLRDGMTFHIDLMGFSPGGAFHAQANEAEPEPEPATLVLLASGLGAALVRRGYREH